ncbi:MAG: metallophosphoesterase family protein [Burkholderiales bacterium]|nr:metallophosphoesterase family protein [Burkholderiales bacterium]
MKLAFLSDVHANIQALDACLAHARDNGADNFALLGDLVGYGAAPNEVLARVVQLASQGAHVIAGNHDHMALRPPATTEKIGESTAQWTHDQLTTEHRAFLASLPLTKQVDTCLLVHASADAPERWRYVDDERSATASLEAATAQAGIRHVFGGHVHHQALYYKGAGRGLMAFKPTPGVPIPTPSHRQWIATVGSVGQPRDGKPLAMYALFDTTQLKLTFHRVAYDHMSAATAIRQAGLPDFFADRLEEGR